MADPIRSLPTDKSNPNHEELTIVNTLFQEHSEGISKIANEMKDAIVAGILFMIFSLPQIDNLLRSVLSFTQNSPIILTVVKGLLFTLVFYFVMNFALS
jgi:hypothetical protein